MHQNAGIVEEEIPLVKLKRTSALFIVELYLTSGHDNQFSRAFRVFTGHEKYLLCLIHL